MSFSVLFVCICVLYYCHRVATQLQLNISYHISYPIVSYIIISIISYHVSYRILSYTIVSYIISYRSYHIMFHIVSYPILSYHISYHIISSYISCIISYHTIPHHIIYIIYIIYHIIPYYKESKSFKSQFFMYASSPSIFYEIHCQSNLMLF